MSLPLPEVSGVPGLREVMEDLRGPLYAGRLAAGDVVELERAIGSPANLLNITAEQASVVELNNQARIEMSKDESLTLRNVLMVYRIRVVSGAVRVLAKKVPPWTPSLVVTRSVTVYGVADAVLQAMQDYYTPGSGSADYTTTDTLSDVIAIDATPYNKITIMVKNTGTTNSADIEVITKANTSGAIEYLEYSATLAPGDTAKIQLNGKYASIIVRAKNTTAGASTTIRVEWIGGK